MSLTCIFKPCKEKLLLGPRWRIEVPNTHDSTWRKHSPNFLAQDSPAPSGQLYVCYVPVEFVFRPIKRFFVLLFILIQCSLQDPSIYTHWMEPWMLRDACWLFLTFTTSNCFIKLIFNLLYYFLAAYACLRSPHNLAIITWAPKS